MHIFKDVCMYVCIGMYVDVCIVCMYVDVCMYCIVLYVCIVLL